MRHLHKRWLISAIALVGLVAAAILAGPMIRRVQAADPRAGGSAAGVVVA